MSSTQSFREVLQKQGLQVPDEKVYFKIENAKELIEKAFKEFVADFVWIKEYDEVVEWMTDNKGRGLFLYGNCGRGKTLLAKYIIPAILLKECGKVLRYYDIQDLKSNFNEIISKKLISLDDIGTEEMINDWGNKREPFAEIMDIVEKKSKLIIVTSNETEEKLISRYGVRILDRIKSTTIRVLFKGESLRK